MFRYMYLGYCQKKSIKINNIDDVHFSLIGYHDDRVFIYLESLSENIDVEQIVNCNYLVPFPDGKKLWRMDRIFHCDPWTESGYPKVSPNDRKPAMCILLLEHDMPVLAYVAHHYLLQEDGKTTFNPYYSIYKLGNTFISIDDYIGEKDPERPSIFNVDVTSIVDATRPIINGGCITNSDGKFAWKKIAGVNSKK